MSRASAILTSINEDPTALLALGAAATGISTAHQAYQAHKRRMEKVQQGGAGEEYRHAKARLSALRRQRFTRPWRLRKTNAAIKRQKERVKQTIDKGMHQYSKNLARATPAGQKEETS